MCINQSRSSKMCKLHSKSCAKTQLLGAWNNWSFCFIPLLAAAATVLWYIYQLQKWTKDNDPFYRSHHAAASISTWIQLRTLEVKKYHYTHQSYSLVPISSWHMTIPSCLIWKSSERYFKSPQRLKDIVKALILPRCSNHVLLKNYDDDIKRKRNHNTLT